eukprot:TRINITY_DN25005_c0_g1_i1.p1 TRINITY_DN25005_c0_g1~~TRINITY_DN25005_c0_g1_i1.p1  ORF type:complete len:105 (-),score=15.89 TRINITY_DN25005_c0_g1_i1:173-487(-)
MVNLGLGVVTKRRTRRLRNDNLGQQLKNNSQKFKFNDPRKVHRSFLWVLGEISKLKRFSHPKPVKRHVKIYLERNPQYIEFIKWDLLLSKPTKYFGLEGFHKMG